ncbi:hypothetical protein NUSPORA_01809 [Nucleospora cyclopteri]
MCYFMILKSSLNYLDICEVLNFFNISWVNKIFILPLFLMLTEKVFLNIIEETKHEKTDIRVCKGYNNQLLIYLLLIKFLIISKHLLEIE